VFRDLKRDDKTSKCGGKWRIVSEVKWSEVKWSEELWWNVCIVMDFFLILYVCYCLCCFCLIVSLLIVLCILFFVNIVINVVINYFMFFNLFFYVCFLVWYVLFCRLCVLFFCIVSPNVYSCSFPICVQFYRHYLSVESKLQLINIWYDIISYNIIKHMSYHNISNT